MRTAHILFALVLAAGTGCTTVHDFHGSAKNLKGDGDQIPPGTHLKTSVACSGAALDETRYIAIRLRRERCWFVLFYPPVESEPSLQAATASCEAAAWLVRGTRPDCDTLARDGRAAPFLMSRAERLHGFIEVLWRDEDDFYIRLELAGETGETAVHAQLAAYTAVWKPVIGLAMLLGFGGARPAEQ